APARPAGSSITEPSAPTARAGRRTAAVRTLRPRTIETTTEIPVSTTVSPNPGEARVTSSKAWPTRPTREPRLHAILRTAYGTAATIDTAASHGTARRHRSPARADRCVRTGH